MKNLTDRIAVSSDGRIWRKPYQVIRGDGHVMSFPEKEYKTFSDKGGYSIFRNQGVNYKVHRVVAELYINNPDNLPEVNHKNGIKSDNRIENLEWVSRSDNQKHAFIVLKRKRGQKLSDEDMLEIYRLRNVDKLMLKEISPMFGVTMQTISNIAKGNRFIIKESNLEF